MKSKLLILGDVVRLVSVLAFLISVPVRLARSQTFAHDLDGTRLRDIPLQFDKVSLTSALGTVGVNVENGFVLFGIEAYTENGKEPAISARIPPGSTLREALSAIIQAAPGYTFGMVSSHLVNVYPLRAENDPDNMLNVKIQGVNLTNVSPGTFLSNPLRYIPELKLALSMSNGGRGGCQIGPGFSDKAPGLTVQAAVANVREALNLMSGASINSAENKKGAAFGWVYLREEFPSADHPAHAWRVHDVWDPARHHVVKP